jgi:hypothetical protein
MARPSKAVGTRVGEMAKIERPPHDTHLSVRMLSKANRIRPRSVERILAEHGLKPYLTRTFMLSRDLTQLGSDKDGPQLTAPAA